MLDFDCVLISGASGAIGSYLTREIALTGPTKIFCLLRDSSSYDRLVKAVGSAIADKIVPIYCDLTTEAYIAVSIAQIGKHNRCLAVHCAGDVSWTKSQRLVAPINVDGTRRFAEISAEISCQRPAIIFLSTAFCDRNYAPRNAYEGTKLIAERMLVDEFADRAYLAILKCSLVVGARSDGWIARFNGLYPLIRIVALAEVPCLIANTSYKIDTIPVDLVSEQVFAAARRLSDDSPMLEVVAASGPNAITVESVVELTSSRVNCLRRAHGLPPLPLVSIIAERKFKFLMNAAKSWDMSERFSRVEQISAIMSGYVAHGSSGRELRSSLLADTIPDPEKYMGSVIDYWLALNASRVLTNREPSWLEARKEPIG